MTQTTTAPDISRFRETMARVCAPVSVVTTIVGDCPHGSTVSAFASLSMTPPMVMLALAKESQLWSRIERTRRFGLNVLAEQHEEAAMAFARSGASKFDGVDWFLDDGVPRLPAVLGWVSCELASVHDGGDHVILLGTVRRTELTDGRPLTYYQREFGTHAPLAQAACSVGKGGWA